MSLSQVFLLALRSLLTMVVAFAMVCLVNMAGGELADWTGFPPAGEARLVWDLGWVFIAGVLATRVLVKLAPRAPRAHALAFFFFWLLLGVVAVARLGSDWPRWFSAGILLTAPLQVWLGFRLARKSVN